MDRTKLLMSPILAAIGMVVLSLGSLGPSTSLANATIAAPTPSFGLGQTSPFPFGLYVAANATLSGDATGAVAIGGAFIANNFTINGACASACPTSLVAPAITNGSDINVGAGNYYVNPTPSASSTYKLYNNGHGSMHPATASSPLAFDSVTTGLQNDASYWSSLSPAANSTAYSDGGSVLTLTGTNTSLNVFNLSTTTISLPTTQITVMIDAPASSTVLINVGARWDSEIKKLTSFKSQVAESRVLWNFGDTSKVAFATPEWYGSVFAPSAAFTGGGQIDGDLIVNSIGANTSNANPEVHAASKLFIGTLPQPTSAPHDTPPPPVVAQPSFTLHKTFDGSAGRTTIVLPGTPPPTGYSYTITAQASGTINAPLMITDPLPSYPGLSYGTPVIATIDSQFTGSCTSILSPLSVSCNISSLTANSTVGFAELTTLATINIPVHLASSTAPGSFANTATLYYDGNTAAHSNTVTTTLVDAAPTTQHRSPSTSNLRQPASKHAQTTGPSPKTEANSVTPSTSGPSPVKLITGPPAAPNAIDSDLVYGIVLLAGGGCALALRVALSRRRRSNQFG
ncbi:collagen-binding domain-containing protein [Ferrimicrobium acidiphilum]|jgi:choice-of-anchor A domain-containing protein|uniref:collagen-binding domain-containing protein n=1 Tax=Ferrimicrobium acidiphilum TaxID=121039 RepID=UPI0023F26FD3|nr:collagen-binding domain-containing protein [Ferrimicrobium acidiphilum]